jgi:hypothetical protein
LSSLLPRSRREIALEIAAACAAAAIFAVPAAAIDLADGRPHPALAALAVVTLALGGAGLHARDRLLVGLFVPVAAITLTLWLAVLFLMAAFGSCNAGHVPAGGWIVGSLVYVGGAVWGFRRALRSLWAVPASLLAGGVCLVAVAVAVTGSTGMCFE